MRHLRRIFLLLGSLVMLLSSVRAEFVFPEKLGDYERGDRFDYEPAGLGYSIAYRGVGHSWITVYIFDLDQENIPEGIQSTIIKDTFDMAVGDVKRAGELGHYTGVSVLPMDQEFAVLSSDFLMSKFEYRVNPGTDDEFAVKSYVFCRGQDGKIMKVRASGPREEAFEDELLAFMLDLRLEVVNKPEAP